MKCPQPNCGKSGAYIRLRTNEIVCRMCGKITPLAELYKIKQELKKNSEQVPPIQPA